MERTAREFSRSQHPRVVAEACKFLIERDARSPQATRIARQVLRDEVPQMDLRGEEAPHALHRWCRRELTYVRETGVEYVAGAMQTFVDRAGDCDDFTTFLGTLSLTCGLPTGVAWVWTGPNQAHVWSVLGRSWDDPTRELVWAVDVLRPEPTLDMTLDGRMPEILLCR